VNGGHCLVSWKKVQRPEILGGLGALDLDLFSRALRLQWLWYQWTDPDCPWVGLELPCNEIDKHLFRISTKAQLDNEQKAKFWESPMA
jgi:hypothetical protein